MNSSTSIPPCLDPLAQSLNLLSSVALSRSLLIFSRLSLSLLCHVSLCLSQRSLSRSLSHLLLSLSLYMSLSSPLNTLSLSLSSLSLLICLSLWGGISSFVNDAGGQGAPEELSAGFYKPSREANTPGERSESWRTTGLTMWLGFEYGTCVLYAHRDRVLREQKRYEYTYMLPEQK